MEDNNLTHKQQRNLKAKERMRRKRENPDYKQDEKERNKRYMKNRRLDDIERREEQKRNTEAHQIIRKDEERRSLEKQRDTEAHKLVRQDEERRFIEQQRDTEAHKIARQDEERRFIEQQRDTEAHKIVREDEERRVIEQLRNTEAHKIVRLDEERRVIEQLRNTEAHKIVRLDEERRVIEQFRDTEAHKLKRSDKEYRLVEQKRDTEAHKNQRADQKRRVDERESDRIARKIARLEIKESISFENLCEQYENNIKKGPTVICNSCCGLFFNSSLRIICLNTLLKNGISREFLESICSISDKLNFCISCHRDVVNGKVPTLSMANGLYFPDIPPELQNMTEVEIRLVSPRLPFMQIRELSKRDRQYAIKGNVVNVPISVDTSVNILPRTFDETHTIQLKLKRKLCYQSHYLYETIRPAICYNATLFLIKTPLYIQENVTISENWLTEHPNQCENYIILEEDKTDIPQNDNTENNELLNKLEELVEVEEENNVTNNDTLWSDTDHSQTIAFAPGEGTYPISLLKDKYAEELSFPTIYCGEPRKTSKSISYANICKWELRHYDRRCCNVAKIFYMFKKRQLQMITKQVSLNLRKRKNTEKITARQILDRDFVENLCSVDDGYRFLKVDRASPPYWQSRKKEVLAMIRQLGIPTLFFTLSAAETRWKELLVILMKTVRNKTITEEKTNDLDYKDKCELISKDPVTCSRYFDKRIRELFHLLQHQNGPFNENPITDTYIRVEFQHRGSPHVHCLLWLDNAPQYNKDDKQSISSCIAFINKYITTSSTIDETLTQLQTHGHSKSCLKFKGDKVVCRFDFPQMPMPSTIILEPVDCANNDKYDMIYDEIRKTLIDLEKRSKQGAVRLADISFEMFLKQLNLSFDEYLYAIQSQLKNTKVFLKRELKDIRVNGYNSAILKLHRANIDIQFIIDPYSCVQYILNYLNKPDRGMSKLLKEAVEEVKSGNFSIQQRLKIIGDRYLKATEISAQEAVYHLLSMDLSRCSRAHIFINTGEQIERNKMVKSEKDLKELNEDSEEIYQKGDLDYYPLRPDSLKNLCLADFCSLYNRYVKKPNKNSKKNTSENDDQIDEEVEIGDVIALRNNSGYLEKRRKPKIIRFKRYSIKNDEYNYYREQCQLYLPWINEDDDLINADIKSKFHKNIDLITLNAAKYTFYQQDVAEFEDKYKEQENEYIENEDKDNKESHDFSVYTIDTDASYSLSEDISDRISTIKMEKYLTPKIQTTEDYNDLMCSLNEKQRKYCMNLLHCIKTKTEAIYNVIIGGAGCGKSCLIKAIYQTLLRYFNSMHGTRPETLKLLLCAPTGKASFNIGGVTTNSAFDIYNQNHEYTQLSHDRRNTLLCNFLDLKLIIIDEISMVGISQFEFINLRLQDIFGNTKLFGGISVVCFGDFYQLRPVQDYFVFKANTKNKYGSLFENHLWNNFKAYELTEIMRQKDDKVFAIALNNLASGNCTTEDIALFKSREINGKNIIQPTNAINLFRTNADVDHFNMTRLNKNANIAYDSRAEDIAEGDVSAEVKQKSLKIVELKKRTETYGLATNLLLKEEGSYMITVNINTEDGLVNGTSGVLKKIEAFNNKPYKLWLQFSDKNVGQKTRQRYQYAIKRSGYDNSWTPIEKISRDIPMNNPKFRQNVRVKRTQFPVVSCEALTINKAQGQSYDDVVVHISSADKRLFLSHVYVALSRARTANGLFIDGNFFQPRKTSAVLEVETEVNRLKTEASLNFSLNYLCDNKSGGIRVIYHNVQSLSKNFRNIQCDKNYMAADILLFNETWLLGEEVIDFSNFSLLTQITSKMERKAYGCAVYTKNIGGKILFTKKYQSGKSYINCIAFNMNNVDFILIYNSAMTSKSELLSNIEECVQKTKNDKVMIIGDFNIDVIKDLNKDFIDKMNYIGFELINNGVTTNGNTQIDLVFTKNLQIDVNVYESYFSYHKPLWFKL